MLLSFYTRYQDPTLFSALKVLMAEKRPILVDRLYGILNPNRFHPVDAEQNGLVEAVRQTLCEGA